MPVSADNTKLTIGKLNVGDGCFQQVRGDVLALVDNLKRSLNQCRTADGKRARTACEPTWGAVGITVDDVNAVGIDAKAVRDQLFVRCDNAGAVLLVAHDEFNAVILELDRGC